MSSIIKVENVSKQYRLGDIGTGALGHDLNRFWHRIRGKEDPYLKIGEANDRTSKGVSDYVWSLRDVDFEIEQGDAVGVIGRNGAGKSTLLKILSRVTAPTTGSIKVKGRIASLLEVGTGFHPDLSGRDNIFLNGAILGMRKHEIRRKFDEIVAFAGVERYIDTPVKRYSSGMYVRLAFAVAAHLESEILIVDEVLAVGDAEFQKKCLGKMGEVSKGEGRTVLFVSHNMAAVRKLCNSGLYLINGKVKAQGKIDSVLGEYTEYFKSRTHWTGQDGNQGIMINETSLLPENYTESSSDDDWGTNTSYILAIKFQINEPLKEIGIGFNIYSDTNEPLVRCFFNDFNNLQTLPEGSYICKFRIPEYTLASGKYNIVFDISRPGIDRVNSEKINLSFELVSKSELGNRYNAENTPNFNSIIRPNWFDEIIKL